MHTVVWWVNLKAKEHVEDLSMDRRTLLKWVVKEQGWRTWTAFVCYWIGTSCRPLFHRMRGFSCLSNVLLDNQKGIFPIEFFSINKHISGIYPLEFK